MNTSLTPKTLWSISGGLWILSFCVGAFCFSLCQQSEVVTTIPTQLPLLKRGPHSFAQSTPLSKALQAPPFQLACSQRYTRLPDLRAVIVYHGCNERPDRSLGHSRVQFGLRGSTTIHSAPVDEKVNLRFDTHTNKWTVSDTPTILTITISPVETGAIVKAVVTTEDGSVLTTPHEFHSFSVLPTPIPQTTGTQSWSLGEESVDASLLDRQGALWWGQDEVIRTLGGDEMEGQASRERIQFGTEKSAYALWAAEGDCYVFDDDRWQATTPGKDSIGKPLLRVKSIEAQTIHFDLWNEDGSLHTGIDLPRRESYSGAKIPEIKLIGAKSRRTWIAEIQGKRILLAPDDWIVMTENGFVTLDSTEHLDQFIEGQIMGELFAFSGIERVNGEMCLVGTFFDLSRTYQEPLNVSLYHSWKPQEHASPSEDNRDEDDMDDFDEGEEEGMESDEIEDEED